MLLASNIYNVAYYRYSYITKLSPLETTHSTCHRVRNIGIHSVDYDVVMHNDDNDEYPKPVQEVYVRQLTLLAELCPLFYNERDDVLLTLDHITHWGVGVPTTYGYQIVNDCSIDDDGSVDDVEVIKYFCCKGLGLCYRIHNYWVHIFLAYFFDHYTSVAIFVQGDKAYFGKHPKKSVFDWGEGRSKSGLGSITVNKDGNTLRHSSRIT